MAPIEILARAGYAARGVVYGIVGFFAVLAAFGSAAAKDQEQALFVILGQPFGRVLLAVVVAGLAGFAVWRIVQALRDTDDHGRSAKGIVARAGLAGSGIAHAGLALSTGAVLIGRSGGGSGGAADEAIGTAVGVLGSTLVAAGIALVFLGVAAAHAVKVWTGRFERHFRCDRDRMRLVRLLGRAGLSARGVVFLVIAALMGYRAAVAGTSPADPPGLRESLEAVQALPVGWLALAVIGVGLAAFAAYSFAAVLYRTIDCRLLPGTAWCHPCLPGTVNSRERPVE